MFGFFICNFVDIAVLIIWVFLNSALPMMLFSYNIFPQLIFH